MTRSPDRFAGPLLEQIKASAGSGKTYTLTRHFIALLDGAVSEAAPFTGQDASSRENGATYAWSEMLAATFTNKAAMEMKERVLAALKKRALGLDGPSRPAFPGTGALSAKAPADPLAARWVETILRRYSALNIRTIDSLLVLFARLSALNLGLPPDFSPGFNAEEYFLPIFDAMVLEAKEHDGQARRDLEALCRARLHWNETSGAERKRFLAGKDFPNPLFEILTLALQSPESLPDSVDEQEVFARIETLKRAVTDSAATLLSLLEAENLRGSKHFMTFLNNAARGENLSKALESAYAGKPFLDDGLLKDSKGKASEEAERAHARLRAACERAKNIALLREARLTVPMLNLTAPLINRLVERMSEEGLVPAVLLPRLAAHILKDAEGASEAFCRLGARLHHLLIDEFQDTSREQWRAILPLAAECLAKGGSLTYVGDTKQAIYGFRGGDAALFDEALEEHELTVIAPNPRRTALACNWRSAPAIVSHNNAVFSKLENPEFAARAARVLLPENAPADVLEETASALSATFAGTAQAMPAGKKWELEGYVRLTRVHGADKEDRDERVRDELRRVLDELLARRAPGDVAVLTRTNKQAADIAELLLGWGIPVITENSLLLGSHPLIRRLTSFLEFLDNPLNGLALCEFLCGPELFGALSGMERESVENWIARAHARRSPAPRDSAWVAGAFRRDFPAAWERCIAPFHARAGLMSAYDLAHEILNFYKVFQRFPQDATFLRRFLETAHGAESEGRGGLSSFLAWWRERGENEKLPMPEAMDAVQVLTMHKAKGLEFPVAIIPYGDAARGREKGYMRHVVEGLDLLLPPSAALGRPYFRRAASRAMETVNLLYVAWTRPAEELHAFITSTPQTARAPQAAILDLLTADLAWDENGVFELGTRPKGTPFGETERKTPENGNAEAARDKESLTGRTSGPDTDAFEERGTGERGIETYGIEACETGTREAEEPGADATRPMAWLPRLKIFRNALEFPLFGERQRGLLIHACLEKLGPAARSPNPREAARRVTRACMNAFPLPVPNPEQTLEEITDMLEWLMTLPGMARRLADGTPEQEIMDSDGTVWRADFAAHYPDHSVVLEYKTGVTAQDAPLPAHAEQLARYLRLMSAARGKPARGFLIYLDRKSVFEVNAS